MTSGGKWYYEIFLDNAETGNNNIVEFGFAFRNFVQYANYLGTDTESWKHIKIMETLMVKHFTIIPKLPIMVQTRNW